MSAKARYNECSRSLTTSERGREGGREGGRERGREEEEEEEEIGTSE